MGYICAVFGFHFVECIAVVGSMDSNAELRLGYFLAFCRIVRSGVGNCVGFEVILTTFINNITTGIFF